MSISEGQTFHRYRVIRPVAQGGMAQVFYAEQELTSGILRPVALKVIRPEFAHNRAFRTMFLDEARTAATLAHPNIVHIYDVGEYNDTLYIAMEWAPGQPLSVVEKSLRTNGRPLSCEAVVAVGVFACSALEAVHSLTLPTQGHINLVHRDISPHNLLLSENGTLKLIDFGIAKAIINQSHTLPGVTKGKAGYVSPEQSMGKPLDGRSDLFSLGVTLYKLASGVTPFDGFPSAVERANALLSGRFAALEKVRAGLPTSFCQVVATALAVKPEHRYESARHMREALESVARELGMLVGPGSLAGYVAEEKVSGPVSNLRSRTERMEALPEPSRAKVWPWAVVLGVALLAAGIKGFHHRTPDTAETFTAAHVRPRVHVESPPPPAPMPPADVVPVAVTQVRPSPRKVLPIPPGTGRLRLGATQESVVSINGKIIGKTPLNLSFPSGSHDVWFETSHGEQGRCLLKVMPDQTRILRYDFVSGRCGE